jgi:multiple sugar transport system substrate-binding protein
MSIFNPALLKAYQTEDGLVGLPLTVYPSGMFFVPALFDKASLSYPPQTYGEKYKMPDGKLVDWNWDTVEAIAKLLTLDRNGKNATQDGFDRTQIVQVGYVPQWQHPNLIGVYDGGASKIYTGDKPGNYKAAIPDLWKKAWKRHYEAMWGAQPWMPNGPLADTLDVGGGNRNVFASGKAAMALTQTSYTCCLSTFVHAGYQFQIGIIPMSADGQVHSRVDADTFRIWKGTRNPDEAFQVLAYLITTGGDKLLPLYDAMPAASSKTDAFFEKKSEQYPFVTQESWEVFKASVAYPDVPSADGYLPNFTEVYARIQAFGDLMDNTPPDQFDFEAEFQKLEDDLTVIFNK